MKNHFNFKTSISTVLLLMLTLNFSAQTFNSPVEYMNYIGEQYTQLTEDQWSYTSAVANDKNARKIESKRQNLLTSNKTAQSKIKKMPGYDGNTAYRDSVVKYLQLNYNVLNEDYAKIMDMEEIAEQSYDLMEAYLLAKEVAGDKLKAAGDMLVGMEKQFAKENNITLEEGEKSKNAKRLEQAGKVYSYYNKIYLIFFKAYKQEAYLLDAVNRQDVNAMEQNKNALLSDAEAGLSTLRKMKSFEDDASLKEAGIEILEFYKNEAENDLNAIVNYFLKKEQFNAVVSAFEAKKKKDRTQKDIDEYNKAVNEFNEATEAYNKANESSYKERSKKIDNWNNTSKKFTKKHI